MKYIEKSVDDDVAYLIPISDLHIGDKSFSKSGRKKLNGYINWVKERDNAFVFLGGDIFNVAGRQTLTSPFDSGTDEYELAIDLFEPIKDKIIGAIDGNHEFRMIDEFGYSPTSLLCKHFNIIYARWSAIIRFKVGKRKDSYNRYRENYFVYYHHLTGGGRRTGSKINKLEDLREIVEGMDVYIGGHTHQLSAHPKEIYYPAMQGKRVERRRMWFVNSGSYYDWGDNYSEQKMYSPPKLGSPRIRFDGKKHDVHISL